MFCTKCGKEIPEGVKFCTKCGAPVNVGHPKPAAPPAPTPPIPTPPPQVEQPRVEQPRVEQPRVEQPKVEQPRVEQPRVEQPKVEQPRVEQPRVEQPQAEQPRAGKQAPGPRPKKGGAGKWIAIVLAVLILLGAGGGFGYYQFTRFKAAQEYKAAMTAAKNSLEDGEYAQAVQSYESALKLRADDPEAKLGLAEAYLRQEKFTSAAAALKELTLDGETSGEDKARYDALTAAARLDPEIGELSTDLFPTVTVALSCGKDAALTQDQVKVRENGTDRTITAFSLENGVASISYQTDDTAGLDSETRSCEITLESGEFTFARSQSYTTPHFEPAQVQLVSTDVSAYPVVRAYFRVEGDGQTLEGLDRQSFVIKERLQGGEYLSREVRAVSSQEERGMNIDLVADKSNSISDYDMDKIKQVMSEFVRSLRYDVGDRAEVLAFDDIVQQMCYYTGDVDLLVNGISNMSTDGMTAFYDAVYRGVTNAKLQGGARCVIAFTDGMDNMSRYSAQDVVSYARASQVPVYIIGVGDAVYGYADTLEDMADSTGGRYWYIDDLYDLGEIYGEIYRAQQELYVVEYTSDSAADPYTARDLDVAVRGGGYKGELSTSFTPSRSVQGVTHTSRYELVQGYTTWEEAAQRCQEMGGHLATITSQEEEDEIIALAEANDVKYLWLGGYTSYDADGNVFGHWVTGEEFDYQDWSDGEPSRQDLDGTPEWYIMLWIVRAADGWCWNDQRNDPGAVSGGLKLHAGFVCEYED